MLVHKYPQKTNIQQNNVNKRMFRVEVMITGFRQIFKIKIVDKGKKDSAVIWLPWCDISLSIICF